MKPIGKSAAAVLISALFVSHNLNATVPPATVSRIEVGDQVGLPEDGCVYAGLGYSDRVFINVRSGIFQCRAQHWYRSVDVSPADGMSPDDFASAHHGDAVRDGHHFAQLVGDEDDRNTTGGQIAHDAE